VTTSWLGKIGKSDDPQSCSVFQRSLAQLKFTVSDFSASALDTIGSSSIARGETKQRFEFFTISSAAR
jgi:hypothetical protein